jgi:hypothetical protein
MFLMDSTVNWIQSRKKVSENKLIDTSQTETQKNRKEKPRTISKGVVYTQ